MQSAQRLLEVAQKEKLTLTPDAAALIARLSDGAMRDALSLLDQCAAADTNVTEELVRRISGVADSGWLFGISEAAVNREPAKALKILDTLVTQGKDLSRFIEELTLHLRNLMLTKSVPDSGLVAAGEEELKKYEKQSRACSAEEIMRWVELVSESLDKINRMKQTGQARLLAESLLIRLCTPTLDRDVSSFAARLGAVENKIEKLQYLDIKPEQVLHTGEGEYEGEWAPAEEKPIYDPNEAAELTDEAAADSGPSAEEQDIPFDPPYTEVKQRPAPSIQQILHNEPECESEPDFDELPPPPPEPVEGQMYFVEPPKQQAPLLQEGEPEEASDEQPLPITETEEQLPPDAQPLPQWSEIVSALPVAARSLLSSTQAFLLGGRIYIQASVSARKILEKGKKAELLRNSTKSVLGGRFELVLLKEQEQQEEKEDRVSPLLQRAKDMGIDVTVNDK